MTALNLRRFTRASALKEIRANHLRQLLTPYEEFFTNRGAPLPPPESSNGLDYEGLARVFMTPDSDTPQGLAEALYFIHEMSTPHGMDDLLYESERRGILLTGDPDPTPADVAVQVWLQNPDLLQRKHAEQHLKRPRSFEYYRTAVFPVPAFETPTRSSLRKLEQALDAWFVTKRRGDGSRVFVFPKPDAVWFLVRHGLPFERKPVIQDGESSSVFFREEAHDVLAYDPVLGELKMNARSKGEKQLYRKQFGRHLFGDDEFFPGTAKYTLEPLRRDGAQSLVCTDVDGMDWVVLKHIEFFRGGPHKEVKVMKATNVFAALEARQGRFPERLPINRASLHVKFSDSKTPRTITIRPPHVTQYTRDDDSVIVERWFRKRGFIIEGA